MSYILIRYSLFIESVDTFVAGRPTLSSNWSGMMVACVCVQLMANMSSLRRTGSSLLLLTIQVSEVGDVSELRRAQENGAGVENS